MSIGDFPESLSQAMLVRCNFSREIGRTTLSNKQVGLRSVCFVASVTSSRNRRPFTFWPNIICTHSHMVAASSNREARAKQMFEDR